MQIFTDEEQTTVMLSLSHKEARDLCAALEKAIEQPYKTGKQKGSMPTGPLNMQSNAFKMARLIASELPVYG